MSQNSAVRSAATAGRSVQGAALSDPERPEIGDGRRVGPI